MAFLEKFDLRGRRSTRTDARVLEEKVDLGVGLGEGTVRRAFVELRNGSTTRGVTLAEKTFDVTNETSLKREAALARLLENNVKLKKDNIPTVPTMRTLEGKDDVLYMTDLTENGAYSVLSSADWERARKREGKFYRSRERFFIANPEEVVREISTLYESSISSGFEMRYPDVFFIRVNNTTHRAEVLLGDLGQIFYKEGLNPKEKMELIRQNHTIARVFLRHMKKHLSSVRPIDESILREVRDRLLNETRQGSKHDPLLRKMFKWFRK